MGQSIEMNKKNQWEETWYAVTKNGPIVRCSDSDNLDQFFNIKIPLKGNKLDTRDTTIEEIVDYLYGWFRDREYIGTGWRPEDD
jgi:hypothetical protein